MRKVFTAVFACLTLFVMCFIFWQSAQTGERSSQQSAQVTEIVAPVVVPDYPKLDAPQQQTVRVTLEAKLRTFAHAFEFAALGACAVLCFCTPRSRRFPRPARGCAAFLFAVLYAVSDEWHQLFVGGRAFEWKDVGTDAIGALAGALAAYGLLCLAEWIASRRKASKAEG